MDRTGHNKKAIIEALKKSLGVVTTACEKAGIGTSTFYNWLKVDKDFAEEVESMDDVALDFVESKLFENIDNNKTAEIIFYLKTRGKKRGYIERQEITGADGMPNDFKIEIIDKIEDTKN